MFKQTNIIHDVPPYICFPFFPAQHPFSSNMCHHFTKLSWGKSYKNLSLPWTNPMLGWFPPKKNWLFLGAQCPSKPGSQRSCAWGGTKVGPGQKWPVPADWHAGFRSDLTKGHQGFLQAPQAPGLTWLDADWHKRYSLRWDAVTSVAKVKHAA